jgi:hypothetical protein
MPGQGFSRPSTRAAGSRATILCRPQRRTVFTLLKRPGLAVANGRKWGHEGPFTRPRLNARCRLGEPTFAGMGGKEEDAP